MISYNIKLTSQVQLNLQSTVPHLMVTLMFCSNVTDATETGFDRVNMEEIFLIVAQPCVESLTATFY